MSAVLGGFLEENHLQDQSYNCGERKHCQDIYNPGRYLPAACLALLTLPEFVELVGLGHARASLVAVA
jgi:hypothetical protein